MILKPILALCVSPTQTSIICTGIRVYVHVHLSIRMLFIHSEIERSSILESDER